MVFYALAACQHDDPAGTEPRQAEPRVIAMLRLTAVDNHTVAGFQAAMDKLGYQEGRHVTYLDAPPAGRGAGEPPSG